MSLELDKRQRAMLREMGIEVWSPLTQAPAASGAEPAAPRPSADSITASAPAVASAPPAPPPAAAPTAARRPAPAPAAADPATGASWLVHGAQLVAGQGDAAAERGPRWLLLAEGRPEELAEGAGELLTNMLRAARLSEGAQVWLAPLQRSASDSAVEGLEDVLAHTEPDVVFLMSRLGAQALLETDEPLGRLRGQVHELWGLPAVVSYDLGTLLRTPTEKAKAWDDLCLALQVARAQHAERLAAE